MEIRSVIFCYILRVLTTKYVSYIPTKNYTDDICACVKELHTRLKGKSIHKSDNKLTDKISDDYINYFALSENPVSLCLMNFVVHQKKKIIVTSISLFFKWLLYHITEYFSSGNSMYVNVKLLEDIKLIEISISPMRYIAVVMPMLIEWLTTGDMFTLRLVCKKFTFDYNYIKNVTFGYKVIRHIAGKREIPQFLQNQIKLFGPIINLDLNYSPKTITKMLTNNKLINYIHNLNLYYAEIDSATIFSNVHTLNLEGTKIKNCDMLSGVHTLNLSRTQVTNVDKLGNVYNLNLSYTEVKDVSKLGIIMCTNPNCMYKQSTHSANHILNLTSTEIEDVSTLGNIYNLNLHGNLIEDVSMLGGVHTLNLSYTRVHNVSKLSNVHTLKLAQTPVSGVSALKNVYYLDLSDTQVTDVSMFGDVHTLKLNNTEVSDVSMLGQVYNLNLTNTAVTDISALGRIQCTDPNCEHIKWQKMHSANHILNLSDTGIMYVGNLFGVYNLNISYTKIKDVSTLGNVHTLDISYTEVTDIFVLANVYVLTAYEIQINKMGPMKNIRSLTLSFAHITDINAIGIINCDVPNCPQNHVELHTHLHTLDLSHSGAINLDILDGIYNLSLTYNTIKDVSVLGKAKCRDLNCKYNAWKKDHSAIHVLNLTGSFVENVSTLGGIHTLNLSNTKVKNVSALAGVHTLNLSGTKIRDVSALGIVQCSFPNCTYRVCNKLHTHIHNLDISNTKVKDVSVLSNVNTLSISHTEVSDISMLTNVETLIAANIKIERDTIKILKQGPLKNVKRITY